MTKARDTSNMDWGKWFYYDETSPSCLRWSHDVVSSNGNPTKVKKGDVAGGLGTKGYYRVQLKGVHFPVHRVVYELVSGIRLTVDEEIDHCDKVRSNNLFSNLEPTLLNARNRSKNTRNKSGVTGVRRTVQKCRGGAVCHYWQATWITLEGKGRNKVFSLLMYGDDLAFKMACDHRARMIAELNAQGARYRQDHGVNVEVL